MHNNVQLICSRRLQTNVLARLSKKIHKSARYCIHTLQRWLLRNNVCRALQLPSPDKYPHQTCPKVSKFSLLLTGLYICQKRFLEVGFRTRVTPFVWFVPLAKLTCTFILTHFECAGVDIRWFSVDGFDTRWIPRNHSCRMTTVLTFEKKSTIMWRAHLQLLYSYKYVYWTCQGKQFLSISLLLNRQYKMTEGQTFENIWKPYMYV